MIIFFGEINKHAINNVGGKAANLGEMVSLNLSVPEGFVLDVNEYLRFIKENGLYDPIHSSIKELRMTESLIEIDKITNSVRERFKNGQISGQLKEKLEQAYQQLGFEQVAVRSSATLEDSAHASFAGQQETYLNVNGMENLIEAIKNCWSSLWSTRSVLYRIRKGIDVEDISLAVIIQKLVTPEAAGVLFTQNPINPSSKQMMIEGIWGLGEGIVSGKISPDSWIIDADTGKILEKHITIKEYQISTDKEGVGIYPVALSKKYEPVLQESTIRQLFTLAKTLVNHYNSEQDIEWAFANGQLYLLQTRPITNTFTPK